MKTPLYNFLNYTKGDRRAILALGCIAIFCIGILMIINALKSYKSNHEAKDEANNEVCSEKIDSIISTINAQSNSFDSNNANDNSKTSYNPNKTTDNLKEFDPNTVDSITLIQHGMKPYQVRNFLHYRQAGKVFKSAEDMANTYGWTKEDIERLKPYIIFHKQFNSNSYANSNINNIKKNYLQEDKASRLNGKNDSTYKSEYPQKFKRHTLLDINTVDSATLRQVPGIGEKICEAIIRYRTRMGGFHSREQLLEINIFSPELLEWFKVEKNYNIKKININKASFQSLNSHPYITYEQTRNLLRYIRLYGKINNENDLLSTNIFTKEELDKLRPYIEY